jgi:hypothetical protein
MDEKIVQEILQALFASLERVETQSSALLQFVKDKGIASDEELAPYLERAGNASGVRWLAARVRIEHLIAGAMKAAEEGSKKEPSKATESNAVADGTPRKTGEKQETQESEGRQRAAEAGNAEADGVTEKNQNQQNQKRENEGDSNDKKNEVKKNAA